MRLPLRLREGVGPVRSLLNPRAQQRDLLRGERLAFARHALVGVGVRDELEEPARRAAARHDGGLAGFTAAQGDGLVVEAQAGFLFHLAVTLVTAAREDGLDVAREVHARGGGRGQRARTAPQRTDDHHERTEGTGFHAAQDCKSNRGFEAIIANSETEMGNARSPRAGLGSPPKPSCLSSNFSPRTKP